MIKIKVNKDLIEVKGHAGYAKAGKDIVCASVSSIIYTTVNGIFNVDKDAMVFEDEQTMRLKIKHHSEIVDILLGSMLSLLEDLEKQYPKNIKIDKGE